MFCKVLYMQFFGKCKIMGCQRWHKSLGPSVPLLYPLFSMNRMILLHYSWARNDIQLLMSIAERFWASTIYKKSRFFVQNGRVYIKLNKEVRKNKYMQSRRLISFYCSFEQWADVHGIFRPRRVKKSMCFWKKHFHRKKKN